MFRSPIIIRRPDHITGVARQCILYIIIVLRELHVGLPVFRMSSLITMLISLAGNKERCSRTGKLLSTSVCVLPS